MFILRSLLRSAAGDGDAGGGGADVFDGAPEPPKSKSDSALPPKPVKAREAPKEAAPSKPRSAQEKRNVADEAAGSLQAHLEAEKAKEAKKSKTELESAAKDDDDAPKPKPKREEPKDDSEPKAKPPEKREPPKSEEKRETDHREDQRFIRAVQDLRTSEGVNKTLRGQLDAANKKVEAAEKRAKEFEARFARGRDKKQAYDFFHEATGLTFKDLVDGLESGEIEPARARASLPPELAEQMERQQAEIDRLRKIEDEREASTREARENEERQRKFGEHVNQAKAWLTENIDEYPALARIPWAAQQIVQQAYQNGGQMEGPARQIQAALVGDLSLLLGDDKAIDLVGGKLSDDEKKHIAEKWGLKVDAPADDEEPQEEADDDEREDEDERVRVKPHSRKAVARTTETTPARKPKSMSRGERSEHANKLLERYLRQNKAG